MRRRVASDRHGEGAAALAPGAVSLSELSTGAAGAVAAVSGGAELAGRLAAMGLTSGARVEVARNPGFGPVIIVIRDTRLALGRGEALQILVMPEALDPA